VAEHNRTLSSDSNDYRELLIGCGRARDKRILVPCHRAAPPGKWMNLTTLDLNPNVGADLQCDLNAAPPWCAIVNGEPFHRVFESDYWDEIHAYEVLEHLGQLGDAHSFLGHFSELWRLLKPNGYLCATVPSWHSRLGWLSRACWHHGGKSWRGLCSVRVPSAA